MTKPRFGVNVPQIKRSWAETAAAAREFEELGFDSIWVNDHLYGPQSPDIPILEAWTAVAALAAITARVEIGTLVTPAGMRNPAHLGKTIATADAIAGGRVIPGLGGGWMEREFTDFGMPFLPVRQRLAQLEETVALLRRMWSEDGPVTFAGEHVRVENVVCEPKPPRTPPILIGGAGERVTLRLGSGGAGAPAPQEIERGEAGAYWGYRVRERGPLRSLVSSWGGRVILTSRRGRPASAADVRMHAAPGAGPLLIAFGSTDRGIHDILGASMRSVQNARTLNFFPGQHTETVRLEEAVLGVLSVLRSGI